MSWELFEHLSRQLSEHVSEIKVVVLYHGGEPLLHRQFVDMVRHLKQLGIPFIKTVSNGMLLTGKIIENVVSSGLDLIEISLDGQSVTENNLVRRPSNGDTVIRNVKRLLEHRKAHPESTLKVAISSTQFVSHLDGDRPATTAPVPGYVVDALGDLVSEVSEFKTTWAMVWPHMAIDEQVYDVVMPNPQEALNECDLVDVTVTVRWNGDVVSCCYDLTSRYILGNILQEPLGDIWNGKKYLGLRRSIDTRRFIPLCTNCSKVVTPRYLTLRQTAVASETVHE